MHRKTISLIALLVLAVFATMLTGCGRRQLIKVNGEKIQYKQFYDRLQKVPIQTGPGAVAPAGRVIVSQMLNEALIKQFAEKQGVAPTEAQINKKMDAMKKQSGGDINKVAQQRGMTLDDLKTQLTVEQARINVITKGISVPDDKVKEAYDRALAEPNSVFKRPEQIRISGVIAKDKAKIDKAYSMLQKGQDFSTVAGAYDEMGGKRTGGVLDWISRTDKRLPKAVIDTAFSLQIGKYSKPVLVQGSWIIVKADMRREARTTEFKEVKDMIRENLAVQEGARKGLFLEALRKFVKNSDIVINAASYKNIADEIKKSATKAVETPLGKTGEVKPAK